MWHCCWKEHNSGNEELPQNRDISQQTQAEGVKLGNILVECGPEKGELQRKIVAEQAVEVVQQRAVGFE